MSQLDVTFSRKSLMLVKISPLLVFLDDVHLFVEFKVAPLAHHDS